MLTNVCITSRHSKATRSDTHLDPKDYLVDMLWCMERCSLCQRWSHDTSFKTLVKTV